MYNEAIVLIGETKQVNEYGDLQITTSEHTVFAELKSITQSEFYQAQAVGFKPEIKFVIADYLDYANEPKVRYTAYNGTEEVYSVIRTYRIGKQLEIICQKGVE